MRSLRFLMMLAGTVASMSIADAAEPEVDPGSITETHVMVPMRDGARLSTYLDTPGGVGPWPVLYEQRYADLRGAGTRKDFARLAAAGYVVAAQDFRGAGLSEGTWVGYRALGWGETRDGDDTIVRVSDVYPDGRSILLMDYVRRARYRDGYDREVPLQPGKVTRVAFDVGWASQVFNRGHRIRITVAGTGAPFYEPNPNTGDPLTIDPPSKTVVATNTVYHERPHASRIIAPVRPGGRR